MAGGQRCGSQRTAAEQDHLQQIYDPASQSSCKLCKHSPVIGHATFVFLSCCHSLELWLNPFPLSCSGSPMYMKTLQRQEFIWADSQSSFQRAASPDHQHRTMLNMRHDCLVIRSIWHKHANAPWAEPAKESSWLNVRVEISRWQPIRMTLHSRGHTNKKKRKARWLAKQWSNCEIVGRGFRL